MVGVGEGGSCSSLQSFQLASLGFESLPQGLGEGL